MTNCVAVALRADLNQPLARQSTWIEYAMRRRFRRMLLMKRDMLVAWTMTTFARYTQDHVLVAVDVGRTRNMLKPSVVAFKTSQR